MNSVLYHNALKYIKINSVVKKELGGQVQMMTCNGKTYPLFTKCQFDLVLFGNQAKGKVNVRAEYNKDDN